MEIKRLAAPLKIRNTTIKNRIVIPAMSDFGTVGPDGMIHQSHIDRYTAYAKGGAGLVIIEACSVVRMRENRDTVVLERDDCIPGLKLLADSIHSFGAATIVQIMLTGLSTMEQTSIAEISRDDFLRYKQAFVNASIRCKTAGFDGIELHAAHGMYLDEIIETSTRDDEYGGCFENRVRLLEELIKEIKSACGKDFLVAVRFGHPDYCGLLKIAAIAQRAGADILDVSTGMGRYQNVPEDFPFDSKIYAASQVKRQTQLPVICVGNITDGQQGEAILDAGYADFVAVGRGHLCDPEWTAKALSGAKPTPCLHCKNCMWYVDGRKCPARQRMENKE